MIKEIKIYNRWKMDDFVKSRGTNFPYPNYLWNLISIYGDGDKELLTNENKNIFHEMGCRNFLSLNFWDITDQMNCPHGIRFRKAQAKQVVEIIKEIQKEKEDSILIAHCSAGISRSGAVGTFVCDYCGLDYNEFIKQNPYIMANPYVLRLLREEAGMTPDFGSHDGIDHYEPEDLDNIF